MKTTAETPVGNKSSATEGKEILGEILSITNKVQPETILIDSLSQLVVKHNSNLNLIHVSTILKKLSQAKLLSEKFVKEPIWDEIFFPLCQDLLLAETRESRMLRTAVSVIICLARAGVLLENPSSELIAKNVAQVEGPSLVQLLAVIPRHWTCFEKLKNRFETDKFELSQIDVSTLLCKPIHGIHSLSIISRCKSFACSGLSFLLSRVSRESALAHIRSRLSFEDISKVSVSDLAAAIRISDDMCPPGMADRIIEDFFTIPCNAKSLMKKLNICEEKRNFKKIADNLHSYLSKSDSEIDWMKVVIALHLVGDCEFDYRVLGNREIKDSTAKFLIQWILSERLGCGNMNNLRFVRLHCPVLEALLVLALDNCGKQQRLKAVKVVAQAIGRPIPGSVYIARQALMKNKSLNVLVEFIEAQLGLVSLEMLQALIPVMSSSEVLIAEVTARLKAGQVNLDQLILTLDAFSHSNCKYRLLDPLFVAIQQWLVPEIAGLNLEAITRISACLEKFGGDSDSQTDSSITTP